MISQNKPQLSAKMEEKFEQMWMINEDGNTAVHAEIIKHFLATALEEQITDLKEIFDCPYVVDVTTCPNRDPSRAEETPDQVVGTLHMSYRRYKKLLAILNGKAE